MEKNDSIAVFTSEGITEIINAGGTQAWVLSKKKAEKMRYVVCIQNHNHKGTQEADHRNAFLIGKISDIKPAPLSPNDRYIINIDSYAEIDIPNQWNRQRNPVSYRELSSMGINISQLKFKPVLK